MFTGLVEETGRVRSVADTAGGIELVVEVKRCAKGLKRGDSLAVNGCCLTATRIARTRTGARVRFDLLKETWTRTNLQFVTPGSLVNLERSLTPASRMGGHFVTGHVDGVGRIRKLQPAGADYVLEIEAPAELRPLLVFKGAVTVDGISLTVAEVRKTFFRVWIIPHTWKLTNLRQRRPGDRVNLEGDLIGKYVARFVRAYTRA